MGLFDSPGLGWGLQAMPKDYLSVYLGKDKAIADAKTKAQEAQAEIMKAVSGVDQSGIHRLLQNQAKSAFATAVTDIADYKASNPNNYMGYGYTRIGQLKNELNDLKSRSAKLTELGKTDDTLLTEPQRRAKAVVNTGSDISELGAIKDPLGTFSVGSNYDPDYQALTGLSISEAVKKRLDDESEMVSTKLTQKGIGGGTGDYFATIVKEQPSTDEEAAKISQELGFTVKSKRAALGELWDESPALRAQYQEAQRGNLVRGDQLVSPAPKVGEYLKNKFIDEYANTGGRKVSTSIQSYPRDASGNYAQSLGVRFSGPGATGSTEQIGAGSSSFPVTGSTTSFSDSFEFVEMPISFKVDRVWNAATGESKSVNGDITINAGSVNKMKYLVATSDNYGWDAAKQEWRKSPPSDSPHATPMIRKGDKIPLTDERLASITSKYPNLPIKEGWFVVGPEDVKTSAGIVKSGRFIPLDRAGANAINAALQKRAGKTKIDLLPVDEMFGQAPSSSTSTPSFKNSYKRKDGTSVSLEDLKKSYSDEQITKFINAKILK
jgi:hypothetical protein